MTMAVTLAVLAGASGAAAGQASTSDGRAAIAPLAEMAKAPTRAERRCRSISRRRLVRLRRLAVSRGQTRVSRSARARVRRKLRRCLSSARSRSKQPSAPKPGDPALPISGSPTAPGGPAPPSLPSFVGVTASDTDGFRLALSRPAVAAGAVTIELRNTDSGPHDLVVEPEGGGDEIARFDPAEPGAVVRKTFALPKGEWRLFCSLPNHATAGMRATLRAE